MAQWAASAYRASQQESTCQSPNKLMFGDEVAQPLDLVYGRDYNVVTCATEYAQWLQTNIAYVHAQAQKHLDVKLKAQKMYYDRKLGKGALKMEKKSCGFGRIGKYLAGTLRGGQQAGRMALLHAGKRR
jgi:hypothetical protein